MYLATHFHAILVLTFGLIWLGLVTVLRAKKRKTMVHLTFFTIFFVYLFKVLDYTLFEFQSLLLLKHFIPNLMVHGRPAAESINFVPLLTLSRGDITTSLLNVLLLVPFGFGLPFITTWRMRKIVALGVLLSVAIECLQLITGLVATVTFRVTDINDVIFNTTGAAIGYVFFCAFCALYRKLPKNERIAQNPFVQYISERTYPASR